MKFKNILKNFFRRIFKEELLELEKQILNTESLNKDLTKITKNFEVSVDVGFQSRSWAVISLQGERSDFIKFVDLGYKDINEISRFLRQFDRIKVDASPQQTAFLKFLGKKHY